MDRALNLLYTCNLRGDLSLLPRLYSLIARLKTDSSTLLLDVGGWRRDHLTDALALTRRPETAPC